MDLKEQNEQLKSALIRLVDMKDYKDKFGKDDFYLENQPETWEFAKTTLKSVGVIVPDTTSNRNKPHVTVCCRVCGYEINRELRIEDNYPENTVKITTELCPKCAPGRESKYVYFLDKEGNKL